jgi:hypothetical protein
MSGMPDPTDTPSSTEPPSPAGEPRAGRRRLLQGALASAPVLMTLVSRPVLAGQCTTPSGYVSANASTAGRGVTCTGRSPEYWISVSAPPHHQWPPGFPPNRPFNSFFNDPPYGPFGGTPGRPAVRDDTAAGRQLHGPFGGRPGGPPMSLLDVLNLPVSPPINDVARMIVAALLNAQAGYTPVLTVAVVRDMWREYSTTFKFSPSSGASWNHDELLDYLQITQSS